MIRTILGSSLLLMLAACDNVTVTDADKVTDTSDTDTSGNKPGDEDGDGYLVSEGDCDDNDANVNPGAEEICDGVDNNCDGTIDEDLELTYYRDSDEDGFGDINDSATGCEPPTGYIADNTDCDDASASVYPGATEICNYIDDNCDGNIDEGVSEAFYADADEDGYGDAGAEMDACEAPAGAVSDNTDCDDTDNTAYPGATEVCDEADNDCDGDVDEGVTTTYYADTDKDGHGDKFNTTEACDVPFGYVDSKDDCDDTDGNVNPDAIEFCNGVDDDCDGTVDEDDAADASTWYLDGDGDLYGSDTSTTACDQPTGYVNNTADCDDVNASVNPGATEICNGIDDDCDGTVDVGAADATTYYADDDGDTYGDALDQKTDCSAPTGYVSDNTDCDDSSSISYPGADEICDGKDNDCDGAIDDNPVSGEGGTYYADVDGDTFGDPDNTTTACGAPSGYVTNYYDCNDGDTSEPIVVETSGSSSGDGSESAPFDSIQDGVDAADECVVVFGGSYGESSISVDKAIDLWGVDGSDDTFVDAGLSTCDYTNPDECEPVFMFATGSGISATVHGFTVSGGTGYGTMSISTADCADSDPGAESTRQCEVTTWEYCGGGAVIMGDSPAFSDMIFQNNTLPDFAQIGTSTDAATWIYSYGGGVCAMDSFATFDDVNVLMNGADQGGGIWAGDNSAIGIMHSWIEENDAQDGGGIALDAGVATVTNSVVACNTAGVDGGGIFAQNSGSGDFTNALFSQNEAMPSSTYGGSSYNGSGTDIQITNSIVEGDSDSTLLVSAGTGMVSYSDVFNGGAGGTLGGTFTAGSGVTNMGSLLSATAGISCDGNRWNDHAELAGSAGSTAGSDGMAIGVEGGSDPM